MKFIFSTILVFLLTAALNNVQAETITIHALKSMIGGSNVSASYNKTKSTIDLRINSVQQAEYALVVLTDRRGNIVFQDRAAIDAETNLEISLADLKSGIYFLRVKSKTIDFSQRYTKE